MPALQLSLQLREYKLCASDSHIHGATGSCHFTAMPATGEQCSFSRAKTNSKGPSVALVLLPALPLWGQGVLSLPQPLCCSKQVSSAVPLQSALQAKSLAFFSIAGLGTPSQRPSAPVGPAMTPAWLGGALGSVARHHLCSAMQPSRVTQHSLPLLAGAHNSSLLAKALPFTRNEVKVSGQVGRQGKGDLPPLGL